MTPPAEDRTEIEAERAALEAHMAVTYADVRGGNFYVLGTKRIHESDLTPSQRSQLKLPALPSEAPVAPKATPPETPTPIAE